MRKLHTNFDVRCKDVDFTTYSDEAWEELSTTLGRSVTAADADRIGDMFVEMFSLDNPEAAITVDDLVQRKMVFSTDSLFDDDGELVFTNVKCLVTGGAKDAQGRTVYATDFGLIVVD